MRRHLILLFLSFFVLSFCLVRFRLLSLEEAFLLLSFFFFGGGGFQRNAKRITLGHLITLRELKKEKKVTYTYTHYGGKKSMHG